MASASENQEAWIAEIKEQLVRYAALRRQVRFFPLFGFLTAPIGLFWAPWVALSILVGWLSLWVTTLYITHMKGWQYRLELEQLRSDAVAAAAAAAAKPSV